MSTRYKVRAAAASPVNRAIGARLRELRRERRLSQLSLGARIGYSQGSIVRWEDGSYAVTMPAFLAWCAALGVDPADEITRIMKNTQEPQR